MKAKVITLQMLLDKGACDEQVRLFKETFPKKGEAKVTKALCAKVAHLFDFEWAAVNFLPGHLWAEYESKRAPLLAEYKSKEAPLWAEYKSKCALLFCELYNSKS